MYQTISGNVTKDSFKKTLWPLFMDGVQLPQGYSHFEEAVYFLLLSSQTFLVLILPTSEGWKTESTLEPPTGFERGTPGLGIQRLHHLAIALYRPLHHQVIIRPISGHHQATALSGHPEEYYQRFQGMFKRVSENVPEDSEEFSRRFQGMFKKIRENINEDSAGC